MFIIIIIIMLVVGSSVVCPSLCTTVVHTVRNSHRREIHVSVRVAPVRGALNPGDHGELKVLHYYYYYFKTHKRLK